MLNNWFDQMHWLAEGDPAKLKVIAEMPVIDFFIMLNKKITETKRYIAQAKKNGWAPKK